MFIRILHRVQYCAGFGCIGTILTVSKVTANYCPISLTCICSKLLEHTIVSNIMNFLDSESAVYPLQHGFRAKHCCEYQLIGFTQEIHDSLNSKTHPDIVVKNFSKAFSIRFITRDWYWNYYELAYTHKLSTGSDWNNSEGHCQWWRIRSLRYPKDQFLDPASS